MKRLRWFFCPRTVWCPTLLGWVGILGALFAPLIAWWHWGENYLCRTQRITSEILVVEGWVGTETIEAAAAEFSLGGYHWIVAAGGPTGEHWNRRRWTHAEVAEDGLVAAGVAREKIIAAPAREVEAQRTYESALAVRQKLTARNLHPTAITVFTRGAHAGRTQLVYAKVFGPTVPVGIISWLPPARQTEPWWHSSTRAKDLLIETIGCLYEALLDSGRHAATTAGAIAPESPPTH